MFVKRVDNHCGSSRHGELFSRCQQDAEKKQRQVTEKNRNWKETVALSLMVFLNAIGITKPFSFDNLRVFCFSVLVKTAYFCCP